MAARRLGIQTVVIPEGNKREIDELPEVVKKDVTFVPVKSVSEVFDLVLEGGAAYREPAAKPLKPARKRVVKPKAIPLQKSEEQPSGVRC